MNKGLKIKGMILMSTRTYIIFAIISTICLSWLIYFYTGNNMEIAFLAVPLIMGVFIIYSVEKRNK